MKYLDSSYSPAERAEDLLERMSLEEKFAQIQGEYLERVGNEVAYPNGVGHVSCIVASIWENRQMLADEIRRAQQYVMEESPHHIPAIFHVETATGTLVPEATVFPNELARAATWDPALEKKIGRAIGRETRALGITHGLAPVLDLSRDPRMGRQGESYGEDPTLASALGVAYIQGLQNDGDVADGVAACGKHFLGFMSSMGGIHGAKVTAGARELREVYGKVFQAAIAKADLKSVMNCYSEVDGIAAGGNKKLLTELLRDEMGFRGIVAADYSSLGQLYSVHRLRESPALAGELALEAGMDCELPMPEVFNKELLERFRKGKTDPELLDRAVLRILTLKFELGLFEHPYPETDEKISTLLKTPEAEGLSLQAARESMVLLKNNGVLPLCLNPENGENSGKKDDPNGYFTEGKENEDRKTESCTPKEENSAHRKKKIALIGWHAGTTRAFFGCYMNFARQESRLGSVVTMAGTEGTKKASTESEMKTYPGSKVKMEHPFTDGLARECYPGMKSIYEELAERCPEAEITYTYGYPYAGNDESGFAEALAAAEEADLVIVTLGGKYGWTTTCTTGEGIDSLNIHIPECQEMFLKKLKELHRPTVGLHFDGRPCCSDVADELDALLECWTPGTHGAEAVVDVLLGAYNPRGKLPVCIALDAGQLPIYYAMERGSGSYQAPSVCFQDYLDGPHAPRYAFGYGLSYSKFEYGSMTVEKAESVTKQNHAGKSYDPEDIIPVYTPDEIIHISVLVKNVSPVPGTDTVQLYVTDEYATVSRPALELAGFAKVELAAGEEKKVHFRIHPSQFAFLDADLRWKIEAGEHTLKIGHASDDICLQQKIRVAEDKWIEGREREFFAEAETEK